MRSACVSSFKAMASPESAQRISSTADLAAGRLSESLAIWPEGAKPITISIPRCSRKTP